VTPERYQQIGHLYQAAVKLEPPQRAAFLQAACAEDAELRRAVEELVSADEQAQAQDFIAGPAVEVAAELLAQDRVRRTVGRQLSHYQVLSLLGTGGMGEVYLASDTRLDRKVALKLLPTEFTQDEDRVRRFIHEAKAASALNHPNIITIYEIGQAQGTHYIATEFIDGQTLRQRMTNERMSLALALDLAIQTAAALAAAHGAGITHRDIKPENVMLRRDGIVKVLDFGLAKLTERPAANVDTDAVTRAKVTTAPGTIMGTPQYMSPEQARGQVVDARSDIFSLGVLLYEMIVGRPPFGGVNALEVIGEILKSEPPPLKSHAAEVPAELQRIVGKALRKDRDERYQTAKDLLQDLKDLREELSFAAKQARSGEKNEAATLSAEATPAAGTAAATTTSAKIILGEIKRHKLGVALTVGLLLIGIVAGVYFLSGRNAGAINSIAVLPFVNASGNADVEYLSDGMTETLISSLSQLPHLNVKARSTVFRYKGKEFDVQKMAQELKVQAILTGRVVQRGDQLTLSLELVNAQTENAIWSEQYNRQQTDLVSLQSEIARDVSSKLKTKLSGADEQKVAKTYTADPAAYQLYLKGRFYWNKRTGEALKQAVEFYQQAIDRDPHYALAYSGLAESYVIFPDYSVALPQDSMPKARAAAMRALEMDDSLAEAHAALGLYLSSFSWNQPAAEKEFRRAIELKPNYPTVHHWLGNGPLSLMGRFDESIAEGRRAEELDPLSPIISADTGANLFRARRFDEAMAQFNRTLTLDPNFYFARYYLATIYHAQGAYAKAIGEYRKALGLTDDPFVKALLARSLAKSGQRGEALKMLDQLKSESAHRYVPSAGLALGYAALGEKDEAFVWLEKEFAEHTTRPPQYAVNPLFDDLRDDPRFADLVRRVTLAKMD